MIRRIDKALLLAVFLLLALAPSATAAPDWRPATLPQAGVFAAPLGEPADLQCRAANRCILTANGGASGFGPSLFTWNGATWKQLANVCGPISVDHSGGVAWPGGSDFWTITEPSPPRAAANFSGESLCRFSGGNVVGSFSRLADRGATDEYFPVDVGDCVNANNCLFGGEYAVTVDGALDGAFHLRWNGTSVTRDFAPQGRAVTDVAAFDGKYIESVAVGPARSSAEAPELTVPEPEVRLLHEVDPNGSGDSAYENVDFIFDGTFGQPELNALDVNGSAATADRIWAVGGGALSGPGSTAPDPFDSGPVVATRTINEDWEQLTVDSSQFDFNAHMLDVAAIPGTDMAIATVLDSVPDGPLLDGNTVIALLDADGTITRQLISTTAGTAMKVDCATPTRCWIATLKGEILEFSDPAESIGVDADPAFASLITFRPNELAEQAIADSPPVDDSLLFAPPPPEEELGTVTRTTRVRAAVRSFKTRLTGTRLKVSFTVVRRARVTISARRKGRTVAVVRSRLLRKGRHTLVLKFNRNRWPTSLAVRVAEPGQEASADGPAS